LFPAHLFPTVQPTLEAGPAEERDVPRLFPAVPCGNVAAAAQLQGGRLAATRPAIARLSPPRLATSHGQPEHLCGKNN